MICFHLHELKGHSKSIALRKWRNGTEHSNVSFSQTFRLLIKPIIGVLSGCTQKHVWVVVWNFPTVSKTLTPFNCSNEAPPLKVCPSARPVLLAVYALSTQGTYGVGHLQADPDELCLLCQPHLVSVLLMLYVKAHCANHERTSNSNDDLTPFTSHWHISNFISKTREVDFLNILTMSSLKSWYYVH